MGKMENKKVNFKMHGYVMVHLDIKLKYELNESQALVYGYLYNHCINLKGSTTESGWFGFGNEQIAESLGISLRTVANSIKALKDKELIIVENERQRARRIALSPKPFYCEETQKALDEVEQLKKQLEAKQEELAHYKQQLEEQYQLSYLAKDLINLGYVTKEEYMTQLKDYNGLLESFNQAVGFTEFYKRLSFVVSKAKPKYDKFAYLREALIQNANDFNKTVSMYDDIE